MTGFGVTIWAYEKTGSATSLSLLGFFFVAPMLIFSPIAGAIVDRYNRKLMMMLSDLASGLATIVILTLLSLGKLEIWHLYLTSVSRVSSRGFNGQLIPPPSPPCCPRSSTPGQMA